MKTYLITGAAGFIGSNYLKYVLHKYEEVKIVAADVLTYAGNLETLQNELTQNNIYFYKYDITDINAMEELFDSHDIDYVINFAAESHVDRSITSPHLFLSTNILGTQSLLECAKKAWRNNEKQERGYKNGVKFLQVSTDEVYGSLTCDYEVGVPLKSENKKLSNFIKQNNTITFGSSSFTENTPLNPRSPYSASKAGADMIVLAYYETYGLPVNITRCSNNYGPYQFPEKLIPLTIKNILEEKSIPVYGQGRNVRDWIYVLDHCKAIERVLEKGRSGEVYNIGALSEKRNIEVVKMLIDCVRKLLQKTDPDKAERLSYNLITYVKDRPGHDLRYAINSEKMMNELEWYPEVSFEKGVEETVKWYLSNTEWSDRVTSGEYQNYYQKMYNERETL